MIFFFQNCQKKINVSNWIANKGLTTENVMNVPIPAPPLKVRKDIKYCKICAWHKADLAKLHYIYFSAYVGDLAAICLFCGYLNCHLLLCIIFNGDFTIILVHYCLLLWDSCFQAPRVIWLIYQLYFDVYFCFWGVLIISLPHLN